MTKNNSGFECCFTIFIYFLSDGVTASGLFTAMFYNMQQMKTNGMCDVCTSVRTVRRHCPQFVNDKVSKQQQREKLPN
jgi:hypothetical protein